MNRKNKEDIKGFLDFLAPEKKDSAARSNKNSATELLTFLENESIRIEKLTHLYSEQSIILQKYPHQQEIKRRLILNNQKLRKEIIAILSKNNSPLMKSLAELFNPHFRN